MRFAYADPPYIGQSRKHYKRDEVDHYDLVHRLHAEYTDGWALSCSSPSLAQILGICEELVPEGFRVMAWVKPFCIFKPNVNPAYAWEPVIVYGGRKRGRDMTTARDWVLANVTLKKGVSGAKPPEFVAWLCDVLNVQKGDTVDDLFPGTGICGYLAALA